jgi:hypothetical protein
MKPRGRWGRGLAGMFLLGATLGTLLDGIHTHLGATAYTHPWVFRMAWWTPLLFGAAFTLGLLRPLLERLLNKPSPSPSTRTALLAMTAFVVAYWLTVVPLGWAVVSGLLLAMFAASWWWLDRTTLDLGVAAAAAIGGPLVEHLLVQAGTFVHLHPLALDVPGWLPFLYMCASVGLCALGKRLVDGG